MIILYENVNFNYFFTFYKIIKMEYEPYLDKGIYNLQSALDVFRTYKSGGYWIKKIDKKGGFHREIIDGPYDKLRAEKETEEWKKFFKFKDLETAKFFTFDELFCKYSYSPELENYLYPEHIWKPPNYMKLFCMISKPEDILVLKINETKGEKFKDFWEYAKTEDINVRKTFDYNIYYNEKNYISIEKSKVAEKIILDYFSNNYEKNILLANLIDDRKIKENITIPQYLLDFKNTCYVIYLNFFKELFEKEKSYKPEKLYKKLNSCLPSDNFHLQDQNLILHFYLLLHSRDYKVKRFSYYKENNKYYLIIGSFDYNITVKIIKNNAFLDINLSDKETNWAIFLQNYLSNDNNITNLISLSALLCFLCKCLGVKNLSIDTQQSEPCFCDNKDIYVKTEIINLLAGRDSIYKKLGFINKKEKELQKILEDYGNMTIGEFLENEDPDQEILSMTLKEAAFNYLYGSCDYDDFCILMKKVEEKIEKQNLKLLDYNINLENQNLKFYRKKF
jgi:hypothetical protein